MSLNADFLLSVNAPFYQNLAGAMAKQAGVVAVEVSTTTNHANRLKFAQAVMGDALNQAIKYCLALIESFGWTAAITDATMIANVASAWDAMSNAFVGA